MTEDVMPKDQIYVLSRCLEKTSQPYGLVHYKFHFNGVYRGYKISYILVQANQFSQLELEQDYLLLVKPYTIKDNVLLTSLIKSRNI